MIVVILLVAEYGVERLLVREIVDVKGRHAGKRIVTIDIIAYLLAKPGDELDDFLNICKFVYITHPGVISAHVSVHYKHVDTRCGYMDCRAVFCGGAVVVREVERFTIEKNARCVASRLVLHHW